MKNAFILFLLFPFTVLAQDLTFGPTYKLDRREGIYKFIHQEQGEFYVHRRSTKMGKNNPPIIEKYNKSGELVYSNTIEKYDVKNVSEGPFFSFDNRILMGIWAEEKKKNVRCSFVEISKKSGGLTGKKIDLGKITFNDKVKKRRLKYAISNDDSKLAVLVENYNKDTSKEKITFKVLDKNLEELWANEVEFDKGNKYFSILKYRLDNEGNFYVLLDKNKTAIGENKYPTDFSYKVIMYKADSDKVEYNLELADNRLISDVTFNINEDKNLVFSGFYSDTAKGLLSGVFSLLVDSKSGEKIQESFRKFEAEELTLFASKRRVKKEKAIGSTFNLNDLLFRSDGSTILIAEDFQIVIESYTTPDGKSRRRQVYYYGPIVVVNTDANGQIKWVSNIKKYQRGGSVSSYSLGVSDEKLDFVYNRVDESKVFLTSIDMNGKQEQKELTQMKDEKLKIRPKTCGQISENEMIIYGLKGEKYNFGLLKL